MAFEVSAGESGVVVSLTGWDRLATWCRRVEVDYAAIVTVSVEPRERLESMVDSRLRGIGSNIGTMQPGRKRVGVMIGRGVVGQQFWAVAPSSADKPLVVVDASDAAPFARLVLDVERPDELVGAITAHLSTH